MTRSASRGSRYGWRRSTKTPVPSGGLDAQVEEVGRAGRPDCPRRTRVPTAAWIADDLATKLKLADCLPASVAVGIAAARVTTRFNCRGYGVAPPRTPPAPRQRTGDGMGTFGPTWTFHRHVATPRIRWIASIRTSRSRTHQDRYRDPNGRQRSRNFTRKKDATRFAASVGTDKIRGDWQDPGSARSPLPTGPTSGSASWAT